MSIVFFLVCKANAEKSIVKIILFDVIVVIFLSIFPVVTKLHFEILPMALLFYLIGYLAKFFFAERKSQYEKTEKYWICLVPVIVICSYWNAPVNMYLSKYGNLILFFAGAFCGIFMTFSLVRGIKENKLLILFGQNSIIVYVIHFKLINLLHLIGKTFFPQLSECNYLYPANWHYFVICIMLFIPIIYICNRWFGILFGRKNGHDIWF